jgi:hypothetical protein
MPAYSKISTLPTALRNLVNEMLDAQKPQCRAEGNEMAKML